MSHLLLISLSPADSSRSSTANKVFCHIYLCLSSFSRSAAQKSDRCDRYSSRAKSQIGRASGFIHNLLKRHKESAMGSFVGAIKAKEAKKKKQLQVLHAKIGELTVERNFLAAAISIVRQCTLLKKSGRPVSGGEPAINFSLVQEVGPAFTGCLPLGGHQGCLVFLVLCPAPHAPPVMRPDN